MEGRPLGLELAPIWDAWTMLVAWPIVPNIGPEVQNLSTNQDPQHQAACQLLAGVSCCCHQVSLLCEAQKGSGGNSSGFLPHLGPNSRAALSTWGGGVAHGPVFPEALCSVQQVLRVYVLTLGTTNAQEPLTPRVPGEGL